jgi:hypothetical protein
MDKEYHRQWRLKNLEKVRAAAKKYYYSHLKKVRQAAAKYRSNPTVKARETQRTKAIHRARRQFIQQFKDKPCMDCGQKFPSCAMDFDHVRGEKLFSLNCSISRTIPSILAEMEKCELVCANCHRIRTYTRLQNIPHSP